MPADRERWLWCRLMTWLVLVLTLLNFVLKAGFEVAEMAPNGQFRKGNP